jgi:hypothetical protein
MATDPREVSIRLLQSIDASLKTLIAMQRGGGQPAERVDLDGPHGDPIVKAKDPRDWTGEPMKGRPFSQCPPEYLDMLADRFDYFASQEQDAKKARYNRLDAARARGWAERIRNGEGPKGEPEFAGVADGDGAEWGDPKW